MIWDLGSESLLTRSPKFEMLGNFEHTVVLFYFLPQNIKLKKLKSSGASPSAIASKFGSRVATCQLSNGSSRIAKVVTLLSGESLYVSSNTVMCALGGDGA